MTAGVSTAAAWTVDPTPQQPSPGSFFVASELTANANSKTLEVGATGVSSFACLSIDWVRIEYDADAASATARDIRLQLLTSSGDVYYQQVINQANATAALIILQLHAGGGAIPALSTGVNTGNAHENHTIPQLYLGDGHKLKVFDNDEIAIEDDMIVHVGLRVLS